MLIESPELLLGYFVLWMQACMLLYEVERCYFYEVWQPVCMQLPGNFNKILSIPAIHQDDPGPAAPLWTRWDPFSFSFSFFFTSLSSCSNFSYKASDVSKSTSICKAEQKTQNLLCELFNFTKHHFNGQCCVPDVVVCTCCPAQMLNCGTWLEGPVIQAFA